MRRTKLKVRILSWVLSFLMAFTAIPTYAAETVSGNDAIVETVSGDDNYELKVLTFEDGDYKGGANFAGESDWSSLIDTENQYSGPLLYGDSMGYASEEEAYKWYDEGNTELKHILPYNYYTYCYMGGGHAISNYVSGDYMTYGDYTNQLTVYKEDVSDVSTSGGGYYGSDNFAVHFGYMDGSDYNSTEELPSLSFGDGEARVIDHMYVNNTIYALNCFLGGNDLTQPLSESDNVKVIATGYHADGTTSQTEIYLADGPENVVMEWTKWDLSCLGEITKIDFNVLGTNDNGYGFSQPGYFAYDNVAVRFEKEAEEITPPAINTYGDISVTVDGEAVELKSEGTESCDYQSFDATILKVTVPADAQKLTITNHSSEYVFSINSDHRADEENDFEQFVQEGASLDVDLTAGHNMICMMEFGPWCVYHLYIETESQGTQNQAPTLREGVSSETTVEMEQNETYSLDLSTIFTDSEEDTLAYTISKDGAEAIEVVGGTYELELTTDADHVFVFQAVDEHGAVSETYTVNLNVAPLLRYEIVTGETGGSGGVGVITNIYIDRLNIKRGVYTKLDDTHRIIDIQLEEDEADDAEFEINWVENFVDKGVEFDAENPIMLTDGQATATLTSKGHFFYNTTLVYTIIISKEANNQPVLAEGIEAETTVEKLVGETFQINLADIFTDADDDIYKYTVAINDGEETRIDAEYSYLETTTGIYKLKFTATDHWGETVSHTVNLTVKNAENTYEVTIKVPDAISPAFYVTGGYDENSRDTLADALTAVKGESKDGWTAYTVAVPENISVISFRGTDSEDTNWGGTSVAVQAGDEIVLRQVNAVITTKALDDAGNKVTPTVDEAQFQIVRDADGYYAVNGDTFVDEYGYRGYRFLLVAGDNAITYTYYAIPGGSVSGDYTKGIGVTKTITTDSAEEATVSLPFEARNIFTVTAPAEAEVVMYSQNWYYDYERIYPNNTINNADGTKSMEFIAGAGAIYRASMDGKITKAGYVNKADEGITITWDGDTRTPDHREAYDTTTQYGRRGDDSMYVNINYRNNLVLREEEDFLLKAYRIWQIINYDTTNLMIEPDFHYDIIQGGDVISIEPTDDLEGVAGESWANIKANKEGVAIFEVSYDAIEILTNNMNADTMSPAVANFTFNASDPARTGLVVVQVGNHAADVNFGIKGNSAYTWDTEFDTLYFLGDHGELKLSPSVETGNIKTVAVSGDKGLTWTTLTADEEGVYTANIVSGNNIIKVVKDDDTESYMVVRGDKVTYTLTEMKDSSDQDGIIEAGEKIKVAIHGAHNVVGKMSGIYNPALYTTHYTFNGEEIVTDGYNPNAFGGVQYYYPNNVNVTIAIPDDAETGDSYTLVKGYTTNGGWGSAPGAHRDIEGSVPPNLDADEVTNDGRNVFPEITVTVGGNTTVTDKVEVESITLDKTAAEVEAGKGIVLTATITPSNATNQTIAWTSSKEAVATVADGVVTGISAGTATITAAIGEVTATCMVTVTSAQAGSDLEFDLIEDEIVGYVTISFADNGIRVDSEEMDEIYQEPLGTIIQAVEVPFKAYDTIAGVTLRLLDAMDISAAYNGTANSGFYLSAIGNFTVNDTYYNSFGEFDAGQGSGWMITWFDIDGKVGPQKDWFINKGASEFYVGDGDIIKWQYTCQIGADIGDDYYTSMVKEVEALIDSIGTVTLQSEADIKAARDAYDALNPILKEAVENYETLVAAEKTYNDLLMQASDEEIAGLVEEKIDAIGEVTLEDKKAIEEARKAYDVLTDAQKALVNNVDKLIAAEKTLKALQQAATMAVEEVYKTTGDYIAGLGTPSVGSIGGEWMALGLARSGREVPAGYYDNVVDYIKENINNNSQLHRAKSTDNSRIILALTAAGYDPREVEGYNLLEGLTDLDYVKKQGINGPIWALIAFDSHNYEIPASDADNPVSRTKLIDTILEAQLEDNGWALSGTVADADMTGMALQALAPYYNVNGKVKEAVDKAIIRLSEMQYEDGSFGSVDGKCTESCAQVIVALTALGNNPETDSRFVKNGNSVVDALCGFAVKGGGFQHIADGKLDGMATEQGYYALTAYVRFLDGKTDLYDMSDVTIETGSESGSGTGSDESTQNKQDEAAAKTVETLIDAIGNVTVNSESKIKAARAAYDKLTAAQKKLVDNYSELIAAETAFDVAKANYVESLIDAIGTVTVNSASRIAKARVAYYNLTDAQKKLVDNYEYLLYAESALEEARVEYVEDLIDSIGDVTKNSKTKINRARTAYNNLSDSNKAKVSNLNVLLEAEAAYTKLAATSTTTKPATKPSTKPATKVEETEDVTDDLTKFAEMVKEQIESINKDSLAGEMLDAILAYEELTEEEKAAIDKEWSIENFKERVAGELQNDSKTGIGVSGAEWNIQIVVDDVLDVTEIQYMQEKLGGNTMLGLWDIYLEDILTGKEVQPDGSILVKIPLALLGDYAAYDGLTVVHYAEDGTVEYLNSTVIGDCIAFNATEFSYYAVAGYMGASPLDNLTEDVISDDVNAAGAPVLPWVIGGGCGLALLAVLLFLVLKNKKAQAGA